MCIWERSRSTGRSPVELRKAEDPTFGIGEGGADFEIELEFKYDL